MEFPSPFGEVGLSREEESLLSSVVGYSFHPLSGKWACQEVQ